ncbi:MAG: hypothetical protein OEN55_01055 [Alphaproteobacteria bacterium]|nr:hypothetical protein [Alphaproteobacteria bacterium]
MPGGIELYGYYVFTHGWGRVLTVMSPAGAAAVRKTVRVEDDVDVKSAIDRLTQYHEKRAGALDRVAERNNIEILNKAEWDARKAALGDSIY